MKNRTAKLIAIVSAAGMMTLSMGTAIAESSHNVADFNGDGMITSEELVTYVQMNFLKMDKDNDGMLSVREAAELKEIFDIDG